MQKTEWIFLTAILMLISTFYFISKQTSYRHLNHIETPKPISKIQVEITGCVRREGTFEVPQGTLLCEILRKAGLKPLSDTSTIDLDQPIDTSLQIHIPELQQIEVRVEGCVAKKVLLNLPIGSRICDLKEIVLTTPEADLAFFKRKRRLKNHEVVCVPNRYSKDSARD